MNNSLDQVSSLATITDVLLRYVVIPLISALIGVGVGVGVGWKKAQKAFQNKKEKRLFSNIARPVALLPTKEDPLELERRLLKSIDFFNVDLFPADARSLDEITKSYRLAIIRYEESETFWRIFETLAYRHIPLIIYSKPAEIPTPNLIRIQKHYTRYTICNTPVRLVSDVYAIMSVYPEEEHGR